MRNIIKCCKGINYTFKEGEKVLIIRNSQDLKTNYIKYGQIGTVITTEKDEFVYIECKDWPDDIYFPWTAWEIWMVPLKYRGFLDFTKE